MLKHQISVSVCECRSYCLEHIFEWVCVLEQIYRWMWAGVIHKSRFMGRFGRF